MPTKSRSTICTRKLLELTLDARSAADPNKNRKLFQNQMRIRIAYGQLDDAARSVTDNNPHVAIEHYRVAKSYAIRILEELDKSLERNKYDVDKADNLNRIFDPNKKTTAAEHEINRPRAE